MSIDEAFAWNVYFVRCPECRLPIQSTGEPTKQRFDYHNRNVNPQRDVVHDRDPRPGLPPLGYSGWCLGHEAMLDA